LEQIVNLSVGTRSLAGRLKGGQRRGDGVESVPMPFDLPTVHFPGPGLEIFPLWPALMMLVVSMCTSTAGVSGAFLLMPFQVSVLGYNGLGVTPTNHLFNVVAIPSGVYRYIREGRMVWPLTFITLVATIPGVLLGSHVRMHSLSNPTSFKFFMGLVLLAIGLRMVAKLVTKGAPKPPAPEQFEVRVTRFDALRLEYEFEGQCHGISVPVLFAVTAVIGVVGGAYGVGGGAFVAPILVSVFRLPVFTIAGAALAGTCITSFVGVIYFAVAATLLGRADLSPDWLLGGLFGLGGLVGMYVGARQQRRLPTRLIETILAIIVTGLAVRYVAGYFL